MTADENAIARGLLSVLERRVRNLRQARPTTTPSQKQLYVLQFPALEHTGGVGQVSPLSTSVRLGSDAAMVVQKVLLVAQAPYVSSIGDNLFAAGNLPFFDLIDRASGGRSLVTSQQANALNNNFPITHFANTLPDESRGANYSFFTLPAEYLLAKGAVVEARLFRQLSEQCTLRIALAGYKVYG